MKKPGWFSVNYSLYVIGLLGIIFLLCGIGIHMICSKMDPCPFGAWERVIAYFGHTCLVFSALCYCLLPFIKRVR